MIGEWHGNTLMTSARNLSSGFLESLFTAKAFSKKILFRFSMRSLTLSVSLKGLKLCRQLARRVGLRFISCSISQMYSFATPRFTFSALSDRKSDKPPLGALEKARDQLCRSSAVRVNDFCVINCLYSMCFKMFFL